MLGIHPSLTPHFPFGHEAALVRNMRRFRLLNTHLQSPFSLFKTFIKL